MTNESRRRDSRPSETIGRRWVINRRLFLKSAVAAAAGPALLSLSCAGSQRGAAASRPVRFGIVTDCHYADADTRERRFYRESLDKLAECVAQMNAEKVDFLIELGDFKDQNEPAVEEETLAHLERIEAVFQQFEGPTYHVLGNHDMDSISKPQFLARVENTGIDADRRYYSFDVKGLHCIVLDANHKTDGTDYDRGNFTSPDANIPAHELNWLRADLAATRRPVVVFVHQPLDAPDRRYVNNAAEVRDILQGSGKVLAAFQGHQHKGGYRDVAGIHYCTLQAMVEGQGLENNAYAVVEVRPDRSIVVTGYRKAVSRELARGSEAPAHSS